MVNSDAWERLQRQGDYEFSEVSPREDRWVTTMCNGCYAFCAARVHVVDGTVVGVKGDPDSPNGRGRLCPKGQAVMGGAMHYDPYRVTKPLKRTNPKGFNVDPGWEEISWDEALDILEEKIGEVLPERKILFNASTNKLHMYGGFPFLHAFGSRGMGIGGGRMCASAIHTVTGVNSGTWESRPDYEYCDYMIFWGSQHGAAAGHCFASSVRHRQEAWRDGTHMVCIDPVYNMSAEKADEWVPIKPGTDTAFVLAMINLYLNEWERFDREYIREETNGAYLIKPDGHYLRHPDSNKCMVWDKKDRTAKPYDDESLGEAAILGEYDVEGLPCTTGLERIREGVREYTPDFAAEECEVPVETITRIAEEFVDAARIGETIEIDGEELRYRPATVYYLQGINGHDNGMLGVMSMEVLLNILGIRGAVGGMIGSMTQNMTWDPQEDTVPHPEYSATTHPEDGHLVISPPDRGIWALPHDMYPLETPEEIDAYTLSNLQPVHFPPEIVTVGSEEYWGLPDLEVVINFGMNEPVSSGNPKEYVEKMKDKFYARFAIQLDESAEALADVVLPTTCALENDYNYPWGWQVGASGTGGLAEPEYGYFVRQSVVDPPGEARPVPEVMLDLTRRLDLTRSVNLAFNELYDLDEEYRLDPEEEYEWEEMLDREVKSLFDGEYDRAWFKDNGVLTWEKKTEEVYWMQMLDNRASLYFEEFETLGDELKELFESRDIEWNYDDYVGVPYYRRCASKREEDSDLEFFLISHRTAFNAASWVNRIPWIDEVNEMDWEGYRVVMHPEPARERGIEEGDTIVVENRIGNQAAGTVTLTEGIRRDCLAVPQTAGRQEREGIDPVGNNKGFRISELIFPYHAGPREFLDFTDLYCGTPDMDVKVTVRPYEG